MFIQWKASAAALAFFVSIYAIAALAQTQDAPRSPSLPTQDSQQRLSDGSKSDATPKSRNLGCELAMRMGYSPESQASIGRALAQQIDSQTKFVTDPVVLAYVNRIGQNLARYSDSDVPFTIKIIDSHSVNALSLPGGFLYLNSGLILAADEEAELAGVIAHEIAHIAVCHAGRQPRPHPSFLAPGDTDNTALGFAGFTRGLEGEADYLGMQYMFLASYDPTALISYLKRIHAMARVPWKPGVVARAFGTHPLDSVRLERSQKWLRDFSSKPEYLVSGSEFDEMKARLAADHPVSRPRNHLN